MGALCCCPCSDDLEGYAYAGNSIYRHCLCLRVFFHQLLCGYVMMLHRVEETAPNEEGTCLTSTNMGIGSEEQDEEDDQRYARLQRDGLVSRKSISHFQEESQPLSRRTMSNSEIKLADYYVPQSSEDEDVCPTCLEEYTLENPKIPAKCSHHFHLGCIYEWLERSESCPVCGKEMEFCESP